MTIDSEVFRGKTIADVFKDIYTHSDDKREQINVYVKKLVMMVRTPEEAAVISPIIKDFLEVSVKNDDQLAKVATIAQRIYVAAQKVSGESGVLSDREKEQLLGTLNKDIASLKEAGSQLKTNDMEDRVAAVEDELAFMTG